MKKKVKPRKALETLRGFNLFMLVPRAGLEPAQLLPLPPQDSVSTSSTTSARKKVYRIERVLASVFFKKM